MLAGMFAPSARWHPRALFGAGEPGVVFDWSNRASLYQDSARTTLVNAAGDPIGSVTDESGNGNHASQPTATSRFIWQGDHAETDGVDDLMVTPPIDFSGTDKITVVSCVRPLVTSSRGLLIEASEEAAVNEGAWKIELPRTGGGNEISPYVRGVAGRAFTDIVAPPPATYMFSVVMAQAPGVDAFPVRRLNGAAVAPGINNTISAPSNYGNFPLFIGRRGTAFVYYGWLYRMIIIGRLLTATELARAEAWAAKPAGVVLP